VLWVRLAQCQVITSARRGSDVRVYLRTTLRHMDEIRHDICQQKFLHLGEIDLNGRSQIDRRSQSTTTESSKIFCLFMIDLDFDIY
jgi:hypothetical protein